MASDDAQGGMVSVVPGDLVRVVKELDSQDGLALWFALRTSNIHDRDIKFIGMLGVGQVALVLATHDGIAGWTGRYSWAYLLTEDGVLAWAVKESLKRVE